MLHALIIFATAAASSGAETPPAFDGYVLGMSVSEAEAVAPGRKSLECAKLMTSRCIVYERRLGQIAAIVTIHFALDDRRVDQIEITPKDSGPYGGASCEAAWSGLNTSLTATYGEPQSREGNTVRWRSGTMALTATVLQEEDEYCDVAASLTAAGAQ